MKHITKLKIAAVHQLCDAKDKSTEFMIQFIQDTCKVSHETVMNYMQSAHDEHVKLFKEVNEFILLLDNIKYDI